MEYDNNMRGALFVNGYKKKDSQPDMRGTCTINGQEYDVAAWRKTAAKNGNIFLSLTFQPPYKGQAATASNPLDFLSGENATSTPDPAPAFTSHQAETDPGFTVDPDDDVPF